MKRRQDEYHHKGRYRNYDSPRQKYYNRGYEYNRNYHNPSPLTPPPSDSSQANPPITNPPPGNSYNPSSKAHPRDQSSSSNNKRRKAKYDEITSDDETAPPPSKQSSSTQEKSLLLENKYLESIKKLEEENSLLKENIAKQKKDSITAAAILNSMYNKTTNTNIGYAINHYKDSDLIKTLEMNHALGILKKKSLTTKDVCEKILMCQKCVIDGKLSWLQASMHGEKPVDGIFENGDLIKAVKTLTAPSLDKDHTVQLNIVLSASALLFGEMLRSSSVTPDIQPIPLPLDLQLRIPANLTKYKTDTDTSTEIGINMIPKEECKALLEQALKKINKDKPVVKKKPRDSEAENDKHFAAIYKEADSFLKKDSPTSEETKESDGKNSSKSSPKN